MEAALWVITAALAFAFSYTMRFAGATLLLGRELSTTGSSRGLQDAITPPWQTNMTLAVYAAVLATAAAMWWITGWMPALGVLAAVFGGSLVAGVVLPKLSGNHYRQVIIRSMIFRYANYVRDGDALRARAMEALLLKVGIDVDEQAR